MKMKIGIGVRLAVIGCVLCLITGCLSTTDEAGFDDGNDAGPYGYGYYYGGGGNDSFFTLSGRGGSLQFFPAGGQSGGGYHYDPEDDAIGNEGDTTPIRTPTTDTDWYYWHK